VLAAAAFAALTAFFLLWMVISIGGPHLTDAVDDLGELVAALVAAWACGLAASRLTTGGACWVLLGASSLAWGAGEAFWSYDDLVRHIPVPFPSLADVGFLAAVPLAVAGILLFPASPRRAADRLQGIFDGCIIAGSMLFASWVTVLQPLYDRHHGTALAHTLSLAYPASDVVMVSLVIILFARAGQRGRASLGLVMAGLVAFAVADSAFTYMTEINNYNNGSFLDTGWVAGYLLIGLGALWTVYAPSVMVHEARVTTLSLVAPYVPVLVVLAVTSVEQLLGRHVGTVGWFMVVALAVLVLGRHILNLCDAAARRHHRSHTDAPSDESSPHQEPDAHPVLLGH
jgi:hypothetical protein